MNTDERQYLLAKIDVVGFNDTFIYYSDFSEIDDLVFHRLRLNYIHAQKQLEEYIKTGTLTRKTLTDKL